MTIDMEVEEPVESTVPDVTVPDTSTEEADATETTEASEVEADADGAEAPEFTPNYKYKVYGKEQEVDEWAKPLISQDNQEHFLKLYSAAKATEQMKEEKETFKTQLNELTNEHGQFKGAFDHLKTLIAEKDYDSLFNLMGISPQILAKHFLKLKSLEEMSPEQRAEYEASVKARQENRALKNLVSEYDQRQANTVKIEHENQLQEALSDSKHRTFIEQFDARRGEGAFRKVVERIGKTHFLETGGDPRTGEGGENLSVQAAVTTALEELGFNPEQLPPSPKAKTDGKNPAPMPNIAKGSAKAPAKKGYTDLAALRAKADSVLSQAD